MKKKTWIAMASLCMASVSVQAGGLLTNTNQNASFLRNFAQEGQINLASLYANPAGNAFLSNGWHLALNSQTAIQQRNIQTSFPLFACNQETPGVASHEFKGKAFAPVIPSVTVSHNWDKWSVSAHFALVGGGGKCEFDKGLGSFEALYASTIAQSLPAMVNATVNDKVGAAMPGIVAGKLQQMGISETYAAALASTGTYTPNTQSQMTGYGLDAYMRGRSYYFGLQLGASYKILDNLSAYIGVRGTYGTCNYYGYVQDISASYAYECTAGYSLPANAALGFPGTTGTQVIKDQGTQDLNDNSLTLNCDQDGIGFTPIFGLDWMINDRWNVAVKYEAPTRMSLKNKSEMNNFAKGQAAQPGNTLAQFKDGEKVREDIPAILAAGGEFKATDNFRVDASAKIYFDKSARKEGNKEDLIDHNTWEVAAGLEFDVNKVITLSASWQSTNYGLSDQYMNDLSFNLSNNSLGLGFLIHATKKLDIDFGYMHTFYNDKTVATKTPIGDKTDIYSRKNDVLGVGVTIAL